MKRRHSKFSNRSSANKPARNQFTPKERAIIDKHRSPLSVQRYLRSLPYNWAPKTLWTFREVVRHGSANCIEAALAAATIMEQHGYPPLLLDLESVDHLDHVLFLFQVGGRWGTIGKSRDVGLHGRKPVFRTVRQLALSYVDPYVDGSGRITGYGVANLETFTRSNWRLSTRNVWAVEQFLIEMPHETLVTSERRHKRVLRKFLEFKKAHPNKPYTDYKDRNKWM
jgi:hypothetical protein